MAEPLAGVEHDQGLCPGEPDPPGTAEEQRELLARLRAVAGAKDAGNVMLRAERAVELRVAELERRLGQDSSSSGTSASREPIGAMDRRKAGRRQRQEPERERRKDRTHGGQPGHPRAGLSRDPDPDERKERRKGCKRLRARELRGVGDSELPRAN